MRIRRRQKGSVIAFSTVLALALVLLGVGFVFLLMYMGGQRETKNATDSGTLNIGKEVLDNIKVPLSGDPSEQLFFDVTSDTDDGSQPNDGFVTLRRINRVWAKAMLIGINADAAGANAGGGSSNAGLAIEAAQNISTRLSQQLSTASNLYPFFNAYAKANSVRMIGSSATTSDLPGPNWQTSLMDRVPITSSARESNIIVNPNMPDSYSMPSSYTTPQTRNPPVSSGAGLTFLKGYTPMPVAGQPIWQVPFQYDEKPRLVSESVFNQSTNGTTPLSWANAVPNAFSAEGVTNNGNHTNEKAVSWVLTNPRETFQMSMPHSFLHVRLDPMYTHYYFFPAGFPLDTGIQEQYYYQVTDQAGPDQAPGGVLCSDVDAGDVPDIGWDVAFQPLYNVIFGPPSGNQASLLNNMVNRVNEMVSKSGKTYSSSDLAAIMGPTTIPFLAQGQTDWYLYSPDGVNVVAAPQMQASVAPMWLATMINNGADGVESSLGDAPGQTAPIGFFPTVTPAPDCFEIWAMGWGEWEKTLYWQPGSGYNGCLGQVRVVRSTNIYVLGVCGTTVI